MTDWNALSDDRFRTEVRDFFEANYPRALRFLPRRLRWDECRDWYLCLSRQGWIAPAWPVEHGGMGLSPSKQIIMLEEQERIGIGRMPDQGITQVGPTLMRYGTAEQQRRFLPPIIAGENIWCQGYSEPNAGSDLANLQTTAVLDGDAYVINGSKIWTSMATDATHMYVLVRTDRDAPRKQAGISFMLLDMTTPGISLRPIRNIAGHEEFCQVFFDNVRTPADHLVGELNQGWTIAKALLGFERLGIGSPRRPRYALTRLEKVARSRGLLDDPVFADRLTQLQLDLADLGSLYERYVDQVRRGQTLGPDVSSLKIWAMELYQRLSELLLEAADEKGALSGPVEFGDEMVEVLAPFYMSRPGTIYGGSNEIQRNIIAKRVLDLPQE
ncbi:MAG: acyl-CoA dehydrogenase family protein [Gammaproteobacteria bacterium]|nr:acyl-CoA dehydrogenase family protein [Gammaproteobacteria bacterium]